MNDPHAREKIPSVLVVDDEADTCSNLADILGDLGYQVDTASDGHSALEMIRARPYDVALLDLKMPGMDGLTLYREIKKLRSGTVAIVVTAYATSDTASEVLDAGAWKILSKPVDLPALMALIDQALDQPMVLLVDDDHDLCDALWDLLRERGFRVSVAHDAAKASQLVRDGSYRVVLIDMKLPDRDGAAVFREVRRANPRMRAIIITGHRTETEELIQRLLQEGADTVCYKPFDVDRLLETVRRLADERGTA